MTKKKVKKKKFNPYTWILGLALGIMALNLAIGVIRKPAHILKPFSKYFYKVPSETWSSYQDIFTYYQTDILDAPLLAAMAQAESAGNPIATPYWQFSFRQDILTMFQPASSSLGIYQMTYDTFEDAKRFCFQEGRLSVDSNKNNLKNCWQNNFRFRFSVSDSVHLTSARLHYYSQALLTKYRAKASATKKQQLAAIIQLCGPGKGEQFIRSGFSLAKMGSCGSHSVSGYVNRVFKYKKTFTAMMN
jgi:hypothetical protein